MVRHTHHLTQMRGGTGHAAFQRILLHFIHLLIPETPSPSCFISTPTHQHGKQGSYCTMAYKAVLTSQWCSSSRHRALRESILYWKLNAKQPRLYKRQSNVGSLYLFNLLAISSCWQYHFFSWSDRIQRLKDARSEATKEIEELKAQKNQEYQNFVAQV